jgi:hypothetical protein
MLSHNPVTAGSAIVMVFKIVVIQNCVEIVRCCGCAAVMEVLCAFCVTERKLYSVVVCCCNGRFVCILCERAEIPNLNYWVCSA